MVIIPMIAASRRERQIELGEIAVRWSRK